MSELNEKIFNCIENVCISYDCKPIIGKQDAADEIEILVLQEKIDLLDKLEGDTWKDIKDRSRSFTCEGRIRINSEIESLTQQLNQLNKTISYVH